MAPEDVKIVARRDPGVHGGPLDKEDVTQNWQRVLREFLLHDGPLHKELEDSAHKFVKTGGCTNLNFALSTLMDTAWSVSVLVLEALEAKRLPAMVTEAFSGDVSFRVRYEQLLKKFNQCRGNYLEEITSLRSVNLQKCRPGESLDDLYKRHLDIFHFVPESALTDDELPYFQQAVEECVRLAVLNTENPSRLQRKELEEQLASTKDQLEQAVERIHDLEDELRSERGQKRADKDVQQMVKSLKSNQKKELAEREAQIEELLGNLKKGEEKIHQMRLRLKQASLDDTDLATIKTESLWKTINQDASLQVQLDEKEAQRKALQERVLELERNAQRAAQDLEFVRNQNEEKDAQLGKSTALLKEKDGELQKARELLVAGEGEVERLTRQQPGGSKSSTVAGAGRGLRRSDSKRMVSKKLEGKSPRASRRNSGASPSLSPEGPASPALSRGRGRRDVAGRVGPQPLRRLPP
ncbi:unnamed protein product [Prorocentrum cordatum]|uniref:Uncharacterized protein n=1 Tax=Prorocentrum cordatum TaxID=2364126 RepID=A0ABN9TY71_9DINO|nr:unnamed protein product [Polarella glacialis]